MATPLLLALGIAIVGALLVVMATMWLRSSTLERFERVLGSRERSEWAYVAIVWVLAILLGIVHSAFVQIPLRISEGLSLGATFAILGLVWPPYMRDPAFSTGQRLVQRVVVTLVGVILLILAAGHAG